MEGIEKVEGNAWVLSMGKAHGQPQDDWPWLPPVERYRLRRRPQSRRPRGWGGIRVKFSLQSRIDTVRFSMNSPESETYPNAEASTPGLVELGWYHTKLQ
jgi:hypothetical protein